MTVIVRQSIVIINVLSSRSRENYNRLKSLYKPMEQWIFFRGNPDQSSILLFIVFFCLKSYTCYSCPLGTELELILQMCITPMLFKSHRKVSQILCS